MRCLRAGVSGRGAGLGAGVGGGAVGAGTGAVWAACLFEPWRECSDTVRTPPDDPAGGVGRAIGRWRTGGDGWSDGTVVRPAAGWARVRSAPLSRAKATEAQLRVASSRPVDERNPERWPPPRRPGHRQEARPSRATGGAAEAAETPPSLPRRRSARAPGEPASQRQGRHWCPASRAWARRPPPHGGDSAAPRAPTKGASASANKTTEGSRSRRSFFIADSTAATSFGGRSGRSVARGGGSKLRI